MSEHCSICQRGGDCGAAPRKPGRPRATESKSAISAWVPTEYHDRLAQIARTNGVTVSAVLCRVIENALARREK